MASKELIISLASDECLVASVPKYDIKVNNSIPPNVTHGLKFQIITTG